MTKVISLVMSKGGVGKSTIAFCLAVYWDKKDKRCLLVDTDPQKTLVDSLDERADCGDMVAAFITASRLEKFVDNERKSGDWDFIIIDTPGSLQDSKPAMVCSDIVITPCQGSAGSYGAFRRSFPYIYRDAKKLILVGVMTRSKSQREDIEVFLSSVGNGIVVSETIDFRSDYSVGTLDGLSIIDLKNKKGIFEIESLAKNVELLTDD